MWRRSLRDTATFVGELRLLDSAPRRQLVALSSEGWELHAGPGVSTWAGARFCSERPAPEEKARPAPEEEARPAPEEEEAKPAPEAEARPAPAKGGDQAGARRGGDEAGSPRGGGEAGARRGRRGWLLRHGREHPSFEVGSSLSGCPRRPRPLACVSLVWLSAVRGPEEDAPSPTG